MHPAHFLTPALAPVLAPVLALALAAGASAQSVTTGAAPRPSGPATSTVSTLPAGKLEIWPEVRPTLEREHAALRDAIGMTGKATSVWEMTTEGQPEITQTYVTEFAIQRPDRLHLKTASLEVFYDQGVLTVYAPRLRQYVQRQVPVWDLRDQIEELSSGQIRSFPGEPILRPGMTVEQALRNVRSAERLREGDFDNRPGVWVLGTATDDRQPTTTPYTYERWFAASDGLTYALRQDFTRMYQELSDRAHAEQTDGQANPKPAPRIVSARWLTTFERTMNPEISGARFAFAPAAGDMKVDRLLFARPNLKAQIDLIGKTAMDLATAVDLDGQPIDAEALKGKVVLLDFWATWCGPCVQALPHIELIRQRLAGQPFVVLGVNRDAPGSAGKVKRFLSKRKFTIPQVDDSAGAIGGFYHVAGIPCTVLIDQSGVIQDIDVGYLPGKEVELLARIEKVLSGQPLRSPEELDRLRAQADAVVAAMAAPPTPPAPSSADAPKPDK